MTEHNNNQETGLNLAAAATLMTLSVSLRCIRDFRYYQSHTPESPSVTDIKKTVKRIKRSTNALHNLLSHKAGLINRPFYFILGRSVHDDLETLHRDLLFFDPDLIAGVIPYIDDERRYWKNYNVDSFYDEKLCNHLEHQVPFVLKKIHKITGTLR